MLTDISSESTVRFVVASVSAALAKSLCYPIERVKLILQVQDNNPLVKSGEMRPYKNLADAFLRIPKEQGVLSLWRGNMITIYRYIPQQAFNFTFYAYFSKQVKKSEMLNNYQRFQKFVAGGLAAFSTVTLLYPLISCQTQVSTDTGSSKGNATVKRKYTGLLQCIRTVVKNRGLLGLYAGFVSASAATSLYRSIYFATFDIGKSTYWSWRNDENFEPIPILVLYGIAQLGALEAGLAVYPLDTISRNMIIQGGRPKAEQEFSGILDCAWKLYTRGGIKALYRGCVANMLRGTSGAIMLVLNDRIIDSILAPKKI